MAKKFSGVSYYGGQNGSGHYQILINHIPKSDVYVEGFLGHSGVINNIHLSPGSMVFGFDRDQRVIDYWRHIYASSSEKFSYGCSYLFCHADYTAARVVAEMIRDKSLFFHFDPPYRNTSAPKKYLYDIATDRDFESFLQFVLSMSGSHRVMVSHWRDPLFDEHLCAIGKFKHIPFRTMSRRGPIDNGIYINYDAGGIELADKSYVGSDFTDRQRIKRKVERNVKKILAMPELERKILLERIFKECKL
jgi:DNA adenine methylase